MLLLTRHNAWIVRGALLIAAAIPILPARAATLYVSTEGRPEWTGRLAEPNASRTDGPLPSLDAARAALRSLRKAGGAGPFEIQLRGGTYPLSVPFVLQPEDSGSEGHPIVYSAYPGEHPVISGGVAVTGWQKADGKLWSAEFPRTPERSAIPRQLFINGNRAQRRALRIPVFSGFRAIAPRTRSSSCHFRPGPFARVGLEAEPRRWS